MLATAGLRCWAEACIRLTATAGWELYDGAILEDAADEVRRDRWRTEREAEAVAARPGLVVDSEAARVARRRMAGEGREKRMDGGERCNRTVLVGGQQDGT